MTTDKPTPIQNRIHSLDFFRGVALLGILLMNITSFSQIGIAYLNPTIGAGLEGINKYIWNMNFLFFDMRFMTMFSILFGAGVILFSNNIVSKGKKAAFWHYKRMFFLLLFGMIHAYFIWPGDILVAYSLCGMLVFLFRNFKTRTLIIIGTIFYLIPILFSLGTYYGMPPAELEATFAFFSPSPEEISAETAVMLGGYIGQLPTRIQSAIELQTLVFLIEQFWKISALMILGMILFKSGFLSAQKSNAFYLRVFSIGMLAGLLISVFGLTQCYGMEWDGAYMMNIGSKYNYVASLFMALGYFSFLALVYKKGIAVNFQKRLQSVGRMAFTNYILMSVLCTLIFYGHGFGLFGTFDRMQMLLVVISVWILMLIISPLILKKYRYGPLEWLWRKLTYWTL